MRISHSRAAVIVQSTVSRRVGTQEYIHTQHLISLMRAYATARVPVSCDLDSPSSPSECRTRLRCQPGRCAACPACSPAYPQPNVGDTPSTQGPAVRAYVRVHVGVYLRAPQPSSAAPRTFGAAPPSSGRQLHSNPCMHALCVRVCACRQKA